MQVTYKFEVNQRVVTAFGEQGIVTVCAVDDGGTRYYVKTAAGGNWFTEQELTASAV